MILKYCLLDEDEPAAQYVCLTVRARERRRERWEHQRWVLYFQVTKKYYNLQTKKNKLNFDYTIKFVLINTSKQDVT
jgi:hypothetical protein